VIGPTIARRLGEETLINLRTMLDARRLTRATPVWFYWDGSTFLTYSDGKAKRLAHIRANPAVQLSLDDPDSTSPITVIHGTARIADELGPCYDQPGWLAKYREKILGRPGRTFQTFAAQYSVPLRITPTRVEQRGPER
jgi:PPOX class probable F420-dependent enzyme